MKKNKIKHKIKKIKDLKKNNISKKSNFQLENWCHKNMKENVKNNCE